MAVDIPALWVAAKDVSETNATERSFKIAAAPGTRGFLSIPGGESTALRAPRRQGGGDPRGGGGQYAAPIVIVADTLDRKGRIELAPFEVDLTAPTVQVEATAGAGERGLLSATITAGEGDNVTWRLVDDRGISAMSGEFVADGTAQLLERQVAEGSYELEVTATDAQGNTTVEQLTAPVAARPMVNPDVVPALTITAVLWALVGLVVFLRRRARRIQKPGGGAAQGRGGRAKRAALVAEHEQAVAAYEEQLATFQVEDLAWERRRAELAQLVTVARGGAVELPETAVEAPPRGARPLRPTSHAGRDAGPRWCRGPGRRRGW